MAEELELSDLQAPFKPKPFYDSMMHVVNMCDQYARAYWLYVLSFVTGCTWEHRAATASPLSGCWIWPSGFLLQCPLTYISVALKASSAPHLTAQIQPGTPLK